MNNIIFPKRNDEEDAKETCTKDESDKSTNVLLGFRRQKIEPVHSRNSADGKNTESTCSRCSTLQMSVTLPVD